jgi:hypothetical protein
VLVVVVVVPVSLLAILFTISLLAMPSELFKKKFTISTRSGYNENIKLARVSETGVVPSADDKALDFE